jgi:membrane fusion protein, copper/silver efflux system
MTKKTLSLLIAFLLTLAGGVWIGRRGRQDGGIAALSAEKKKAVYQCAMHPQIVSDRPGQCPICHMELTKVEERHPEEGAPAPGKKHKVLFYRHPMNPSVTSSTPAKDEMGMDYVPVYEDEAEDAGSSDIPGHAPFALSAERQQLIGVKTAAVELKPLTLEVRTVGQVAYDPELYNALAEYREALKAQEKLQGASPDAQEPVNALMKSSALRLRLMGLSDEQIREMAAHDEDPVNLLLPGKSVWVYAQIYEAEAESVRPGQAVAVMLPAARSRVYTGKVVAVDPVLNAATRTLRARIRVETPGARLKPEAFVNVKIQVPLGKILSVPEDAVLDTGERQLVFVASGEGRFEPRAVETGRIAEGRYEVLSGVEEGERVVTAANFLIDSESRFRSAVSSFGEKDAGGAGHAH